MVDTLFFDIEANGLLDEATRIHCAVTKHTTSTNRYTPNDITLFISYLSNLRTDTIIVGHNI